MLYKLLKLPAKIVIFFYCRYIGINKKDILNKQGPLLIASNHPNSFLDAIILATLFKRPIYSLARGDAFASPLISKILIGLNMLPVYRITEGVENLENNFTTFSACIELFRKNAIVLIFSEGRCINEWKLRPLKKGTARLALSAWNENIPLEILPLGINYNTFRAYGKNVYLNFGNVLTQSAVLNDGPEGKRITDFNAKLNAEMEKLVYEIAPGDEKSRRDKVTRKVSPLKKILLFIPAFFGWIIHYPLYAPTKSLIKNKANDHFDSIIVGIMLFAYPVYLLVLFTIITLVFSVCWGIGTMIILPVLLWSYLQIKKQ